MLVTIDDPNDRLNWRQAIVNEAQLSGQVAELMRGAIRRQIINDAALAAGIKPTQAELQAAADNIRMVDRLVTVEATNKWLAANFISVGDFEQIVRDRLITAKLAHHLFADRVEHFFWQNSLEYASATLYEVVLTDKYVAMEIFYALTEGDLNFNDVARQYITDPELHRRGGYLGTINRKQLRPEISAAVFAAQPPQTISPITTELGIHLIRVAEIIQPQLDSVIYQQILIELFDRWVEECLGGRG
jgi:parvulin-like peptidyl-prolyl isomerase